MIIPRDFPTLYYAHALCESNDPLMLLITPVVILQRLRYVRTLSSAALTWGSRIAASPPGPDHHSSVGTRGRDGGEAGGGGGPSAGGEGGAGDGDLVMLCVGGVSIQHMH